MINCAITKDQQKALYSLIYGDLLKAATSGEDFSFEEYIKKIYNLINDAQNNPHMALDYARLVPHYLKTAAARNFDIDDYLMDKADMKALNVLRRDFDADIKNVQDYLAVNEAVVEDLKTLEEQTKKESLDPGIPESTIEAVQPELSEFDGPELALLSDQMYEKAGNEKEDEFYNTIKNKVITAALGTPAGTQIELEGIGPVTLTLMRADKIEDRHLKDSVKTFLKNGGEKARKQHEEGVVLVLTRPGGSPIYFNELYKDTTADEGKPAYYELRKPRVDKDGNIAFEPGDAKYETYDEARAKAIAANRNIPYVEAKALVVRQLELYNRLREYIKNNPEATFAFDITGGSFGKLVSSPSFATPVAKIDFTQTAFAPKLHKQAIASKGIVAGGTYFEVEGIAQAIRLEKPTYSNALAAKLGSILVDDLKVETPEGLRPITNSERIRLFKQFVLTSAETIDVFPADNNAVTIKVQGTKLDLASPDATKKFIGTYLTRLAPIREISKEQIASRKVIKASDPRYPELLSVNTVVEQENPGGKNRYYVVEYAKQNIVDNLLTKNSIDDFVIEGDVVKPNKKNYTDYLKDNFIVFYPVDAKGKLRAKNPYFTFQPKLGELNKLSVVSKKEIIEKAKTEAPKKTDSGITAPAAPEVKSPSDALKVFKDAALKRRGKLNKILAQKVVNGKATPEQIEEARTWYANHPLSKYYPFEEAFSLINTEDPKAIATWEMNGITLYKGADYSDLYHEAWHGFTQGFLSQKDKQNLYAEARKKTGLFKDYAGRTVSFKYATDLQIEEYLAEDFRTYMLSGATKVDPKSVQRNNIFRKIWNFLRTLFGNMTVSDVALDAQANSTIRDLYEKLRVGDINGYSFAAENRNFNTLNLGMQRIGENEPLPSLNYEDSKLILDTVDSLFSEYADFVNEGLTDDQKLEKAALELKDTLTPEEKTRLKELKCKQTYQYATELFSSPTNLPEVYEYVKLRMSQIRDTVAEDVTSNPQLKKTLDAIDFALRNFGDTTSLGTAAEGKGVIGYHLFKSEFISRDTLKDVLEEEQDAAQEVEGKEVYDRGGNERSPYDLMKKEVSYLLQGLYATDKEGNVLYNRLGVPQLAPMKKSFNRVLYVVANLTTRQEMYDTLVRESDNYPPIKQLLEKLGPPSYEGQTETEVQNWVKFWQTFNKYRIPLKQLNVDEVTEDEEGNTIPLQFQVTIGEVSGDFSKVQSTWEGAFAQSTDKFVKNDKIGNYFDLPAVTAKWPNVESIEGKEFEFLSDLGVKLTDDKGVRTALEKAINSGDIKLQDLVKTLHTLSSEGIRIRHVAGAFKAYPDLNIKGEQGNYKKLALLEARHGGDVSDFMRSNAVGDAQSEFSLNTSLTQFIKRINGAQSFRELVSQDSMQHLAPEIQGLLKNPFTRNSQWLNTIFDMNDGQGGKRRPNKQLVVDNLSGVTLLKNGGSTDTGTISASADGATKLIMDIHTQLMTGTPELARAADKKTSLSVYVDGLKLYVDTHKFFDTGTTDFPVILGAEEAFEIILPYIQSELTRVQECRRLLADKLTSDYDFTYLNRGNKFVMFEGVLSDTTKDKLYEVKGDLKEYLDSPEGTDLKGRIYGDVNKYFIQQANGVRKKLNEAKFISESLRQQVKRDAEKFITKDKLTTANIDDAIIRSFVYNNWIHHVEEAIVIFGDPAQYNMGKEEYQKRIAGFNSTGDVMCTDDAFISYINKTVKRPYAIARGIEPASYNGTLNTAVLSDVEIGSVYHTEYEAALKEAAAKYGEGGVNEGDAQGWVSFDAYRIIAKSLGDWSETQEFLFQEIVKGRRISPMDVQEFFPVRKMSYAGPLATNYLAINALHKFSLFPLIPTVVKGTNLEKLHDKMVSEGVDYVLFKSGSKISTITKSGMPDKLYSNVQKRTLDTTPFTKNIVFADYLKNQIQVAPKFKKKVTFFTQLRKLVDTGLMENGIPTDFKAGKEAWAKLSEAKKMETSKNYRLRKQFLDDVFKLGELKKKQLLDEMGWTTDKNGKPVGDIKRLAEFVANELERSDLGDHEKEFLQIGPDGKLKHDLSLSLSADKIEKILVALVNKRLVRYKVNGEQLVQVSAAGFENLDFAYTEARKFEKPTAEDLAKYGTNDLPTYHKGKDGKTRAAKVKIAIQGDFKKLLRLADVQQKATDDGISLLQALNALIKDEAFLNRGDNRAMITMIGARIPTQGLNSMEFVEVYEFLPEEAGNIIIAPSEITSKSGTDFDYDKLPMMMPNIKTFGSRVELLQNFSREKAKQIYDTLVKYEVNKATLAGTNLSEVRSMMKPGMFAKFEEAMIKLLGDSYLEDIEAVVKEDKKIPDFETFFTRLNGEKAIENQMIAHVREILEQPENFVNLIKPNDTNLVEPLAKNLAKHVAEGYTGKKGVEGNKVFEVLYNLEKHQSNSVGKETLGIGAVNNTYNTVLNGIGAYLTKSYTVGRDKTHYRNTILLPHNQVSVDGEDVVSLGGLWDAEHKNYIPDVISQLMNGWVDVAKDAWIFYLQANKELAPILLFMVKAGVPIEDAVYLISQPLVREYVRQQQLYKSTFAPALGKRLSNPNSYRADALRDILTSPANDFQIPLNDKGRITRKALYEITLSLTKEYPQALSKEKLLQNIEEANKAGKKGYSNEERAAFLHFIEIENMAKNLTDITTSTNIDTNPSGNLSEAEEALGKLDKLRDSRRLPSFVVNTILSNSAIGAYQVQEFTLDIFGDLFKLRHHPKLAEFLSSIKSDESYKTAVKAFKDESAFVEAFRNDLVNYIFQNAVRQFNPNMTEYKGNKLSEHTKVEEVEGLNFGAFVKNNTLYVDKKKLEEQFWNAEYSTDGYVKKGLAKVYIEAFATPEEYMRFVYERETLRHTLPFASIQENADYQGRLRRNYAKDENRKEGEDGDEFLKRMKRRSYEEFIRDKALDNILNFWKIFKSNNTYADQYVRIRNKYPELIERYSLLRNLQYVSNKGLGYRNLKLSDAKLDKDLIELYHENLVDLANRSVVKVDDMQDNDMISDFFSKFPIYAFLQSGMNTKSVFSMGRIVPQDTFIRIMEKPAKEWTEKMNDVVLMDYYHKFMANNLNRGARVRGKNYLSNVTFDTNAAAVYVGGAVFPAPTEEAEAIVTQTPGTILSKPKQVSDEEINDFLNNCYL